MWKVLCKNIMKGFESTSKGAVNQTIRNNWRSNIPFALGFKYNIITKDGKWIELGISGREIVWTMGGRYAGMSSCLVSLKCRTFKKNRKWGSDIKEVEIRGGSLKRLVKLWNNHFTEWEREFTRNNYISYHLWVLTMCQALC